MPREPWYESDNPSRVARGAGWRSGVMADRARPQPPVFQPPTAPDKPTPEQPRLRVACRECGAPAELYPGQRMPEHNVATVGPGRVIRDSGKHCKGTGKPPERA